MRAAATAPGRHARPSGPRDNVRMLGRHAAELVLDELSFTIRRSPRRHTIGITVERDGTLRLAVPSRCSRKTLEAVVRGKLDWVRRKLAEYEAMGPPPEPPDFVDGERLPYLGRRHRLRVLPAPPDTAPSLALRRGRFELTMPAAANGRDRATAARAAFTAWYTARAKAILAERVATLAVAHGLQPGQIRVRDMGRRWGTCDSRGGVLSFHWRVVLLPPALVDYVVIHELMHLREPNHGPGFWAHVAQALPDWRERRRALHAEAADPRI